MTQDSTHFLEKMELLEFNLITGPNDSTRVTQISRKTIDLVYANFPGTTRFIEHAIFDNYSVEVDFNLRLTKNYEKKKIITVEL